MMPDDPRQQARLWDGTLQQAPATQSQPSRPAPDAEVPDAIEAASTQHEEAETTKEQVRAKKARGVDWVRPTDLLTRASSPLAGRGIDLQSKLARRVDHRIATGAKFLATKTAKLPPLSSFGRGRTHELPTRPAIGRK